MPSTLRCLSEQSCGLGNQVCSPCAARRLGNPEEVGLRLPRGHRRPIVGQRGYPVARCHPAITSASLGTLGAMEPRSPEHTSELQSLRHLVCRLLLEKKKKKKNN